MTGNPAKGRASRRRTISGFPLTAFGPAGTGEMEDELSLSVRSEPKAQTNEATTPSMVSSAPMDSISPLSIGSPLQTSSSVDRMARCGGDDDRLGAGDEGDFQGLPVRRWPLNIDAPRKVFDFTPGFKVVFVLFKAFCYRSPARRSLGYFADLSQASSTWIPTSAISVVANAFLF